MGVIGRAAEAAGHEVFTCRWDEGDAAREDASAEGAWNRRIVVPPKRWPHDVLRQHLAFARPFARYLAEVRPDVVVTNFVVPGGLAAVQARSAGIAAIVAIRHEDFRALSPHLRVWTRMAAACVDSAVYVSSTVARSYGAPDAEVHEGGAVGRHVVIRNGIDHRALSGVVPHDRAAGPQPIVVAARLVETKGIDLCLEALALARTRDPSLTLEIIGDGPLRGVLERQASRLGPENCVTFTGWLPRQAALARMKSARAVVVPSRTEGYGLVLAEAMALGTPVITSDLPVLREVASFGEGAQFFPRGDAGALADALSGHLPQSRLRANALDHGRMAASYVRLFEALVAQRSSLRSAATQS